MTKQKPASNQKLPFKILFIVLWSMASFGLVVGLLVWRIAHTPAIQSLETGSRLWIIGSCTLLFLGLMSLVVFIALDRIFATQLRLYTLRLEKRIEEVIAQRDSERAKAFEANRMIAIGEIAAGMAHEINNPLTIIDGKAQLLKKILKDPSQFEKIEPGLQKITEMVTRISRITHSLQDFYRPRDSRLEQIVSIHQILHSQIDLYKPKADVRNVQFVYKSCDDNLFCMGDEFQLSQVFFSLIKNALEAVSLLPDSNLAAQITVEEKILDDRQIQISIFDNGPGLEQGNETKLFQPFFTTKQDGSQGLSLSQAYGFIRSHGGDLDYIRHSTMTEFRLTLPRAATQSVAKVA